MINRNVGTDSDMDAPIHKNPFPTNPNGGTDVNVDVGINKACCLFL